MEGGGRSVPKPLPAPFSPLARGSRELLPLTPPCRGVFAGERNTPLDRRQPPKLPPRSHSPPSKGGKGAPPTHPSYQRGVCGGGGDSDQELSPLLFSSPLARGGLKGAPPTRPPLLGGVCGGEGPFPRSLSSPPTPHNKGVGVGVKGGSSHSPLLCEGCLRGRGTSLWRGDSLQAFPPLPISPPPARGGEKGELLPLTPCCRGVFAGGEVTASDNLSPLPFPPSD